MSEPTPPPATAALPPGGPATQPATVQACRQDYATGEAARDALTATVNDPHPGTTPAVAR